MKKALIRHLDVVISDFENAAIKFTRDPFVANSALHDLRVALRSLRACVRVLLSADDCAGLRELTKKLRLISRATSAARDEQVLKEMLSGTNLNDWVKGRDTQRCRALELVCKHLERENPEALAREMRDVIHESIVKNRRKKIASAASDIVCSDERKLLRDGQCIKKKTSDSAFLHRYRIRAKKLRYTIKVFDSALPKSCDLIAPLAKKTQDALGKVHDFDEAISIIKRTKGAKKHQESLSRLQNMRNRAVKKALVTVKHLIDEA